MNISENKRVTALAALFSLAFCGVMYVGYQSQTDAMAANARLAEIDEKFVNYSRQDFPPTAASVKTLRKSLGTITNLKKSLDSDLAGYRSRCVGDGKMSTAVEFQSKLRVAIAQTAKIAAEKKVSLSNTASDLGTGNLKNVAALQEEVPYREFLLDATNSLMMMLLDAEVASVDKVFIAPLPEECDSGLRRPPAYFPMSMEISFAAKRGDLPSIINHIIQNKDYFFILTGVAALSDTSIPDVVDGEQNAPQVQVVQNDGISDEAALDVVVQDRGVQIASRKLGNPTETVRVHLTLQLLYFNAPNKVK